MKHYELEINDFLDGELETDEQRELFAHLSECELCCGNFNKYLLLKQESAKQIGKDIHSIIGEVKTTVSLPAADIKQITPVKNNIFYKTAFYTSAAAALILFFLLINHKPEINYLTRETSRVDTVFVPMEKVVYKTIQQTKTIKEISPEANQKTYVKYLAGIPEKHMQLVSLPEINNED